MVHTFQLDIGNSWKLQFLVGSIDFLGNQ